MVACKRDVAGVTFERRNETFCGIVPDLDGAVVRGGQNVGFVRLRVVIDVIDTLCLVCFEGDICGRRAETPYLDSAIETCRSKGIGVFWIDGETHDIVTVTLERLHAFPRLVPIPELDCHVIRGSQNKGLRWMHNDGPDVIWVCFKGGDLFRSVVVVDSQLKVVGPADDPILARNEAAGSDGDIGQFECLDGGLDVVSRALPGLVSWQTCVSYDHMYTCPL